MDPKYGLRVDIKVSGSDVAPVKQALAAYAFHSEIRTMEKGTDNA